MYSDVHELNYSKIKSYQECPLLYKYKYIDGRKEGLVPASSLGVSIHRALEQYHRHSNDPSELLSYYDDCWLGAGYSSAAEQMEYYLKGEITDPARKDLEQRMFNSKVVGNSGKKR